MWLFAGARTHSNNTAEMTTMFEALCFLGSHGPVARDANSCLFFDPKHAAGMRLGTIQARMHFPLAFENQRAMLKAQQTLRLTMQHVYGHTGNLGNECADHAPALGALSLVSRHNLTSRWTQPSFIATTCFALCHTDGDILEKLQSVRTEMGIVYQHQN